MFLVHKIYFLILSPSKYNATSNEIATLIMYLTVAIFLVQSNDYSSGYNHLKLPEHIMVTNYVTCITRSPLCQVRGGLQPACSWFIEIAFVWEGGVCVCMCVCLSVCVSACMSVCVSLSLLSGTHVKYLLMMSPGNYCFKVKFYVVHLHSYCW